jgi:hypothetical protein
MFREFSEVREVREVKGNLWEKASKDNTKLSEEILKALDRKIVVTREFDSINEEVINKADEVKDLWRLQFIITDELEYKLSLFNRDNFGKRTVELDKIEILNIKHKISKDDYKFNLIVMYKLVKKINSKQDIKDLKDKIEYRYAVLMNNDIAGFVE